MRIRQRPWGEKYPEREKGDPLRAQGLDLVDATFGKLVSDEDEHNAESRNQHGRKRRLNAGDEACRSGEHVRSRSGNRDGFALRQHGERRKGRDAKNELLHDSNLPYLSYPHPSGTEVNGLDFAQSLFRQLERQENLEDE